MGLMGPIAYSDKNHARGTKGYIIRELQGDVGEDGDGGANGRGERTKAFLRRMVLHIEVNIVYRLERMEQEEEERTMEHNCRRLSCFSWSSASKKASCSSNIDQQRDLEVVPPFPNSLLPKRNTMHPTPLHHLLLLEQTLLLCHQRTI